MAKVVLPRVHALILCDDVEPAAGQEGVWDLLGVRTKIWAAAFPHVPPRLCVYLQLTGHEGRVSLVLAVLNAGTDEEVFRGSIPPITLLGPLNVVARAVVISGCGFPEPGLYYFQVYFEGKLLFERPLHLIDSGATGNGQQAT